MTASPVAAATVQFNPETRLFIDGQLRESSTGKTVDNINPATEEVLGVAHRRRCRRHGRGDRRRASGLRHHRLVDQPRLPAALPRAAARCAAGREGRHPRRADRRGRRDRGDDLHRAAGVAAGRRRPIPRGATSRRSSGSGCSTRTPRWACPTTASWSRNPWVWSRPSRRGTSRSRSSATRWARSWPPATRWCSSRPSRRRGARCAGAGSSPRRPTSPQASSTSSRRRTTTSLRCSPPTRGPTWSRSPVRRRSAS